MGNSTYKNVISHNLIIILLFKARDNNLVFFVVDLNDILEILVQYIYLTYSEILAYYDDVLYNFILYILNNFPRSLLNVCAETPSFYLELCCLSHKSSNILNILNISNLEGIYK